MKNMMNKEIESEKESPDTIESLKAKLKEATDTISNMRHDCNRLVLTKKVHVVGYDSNKKELKIITENNTSYNIIVPEQIYINYVNILSKEIGLAVV